MLKKLYFYLIKQIVLSMLNSCLVYFDIALKVESHIIHLEKHLIEVKKTKFITVLEVQGAPRPSF